MIADTDQLNKKVSIKLQEQEQAVGPKIIAGLIAEVQDEQLVNDGFVPLGNTALVSDRTILRYAMVVQIDRTISRYAMVAQIEAVRNDNNVQLTKHSLKKPNSWIM
jgi:hypothetical protein